MTVHGAVSGNSIVGHSFVISLRIGAFDTALGPSQRISKQEVLPGITKGCVLTVFPAKREIRGLLCLLFQLSLFDGLCFKLIILSAGVSGFDALCNFIGAFF